MLLEGVSFNILERIGFDVLQGIRGYAGVGIGRRRLFGDQCGALRAVEIAARAADEQTGDNRTEHDNGYRHGIVVGGRGHRKMKVLIMLSVYISPHRRPTHGVYNTLILRSVPL